MLHIAADALAAAVELCPLFFAERKLDHLLDAVCPKDARNAREQPRLAILAAKLGAGRHDGLFVVQHNVRHPCRRCRNAVLGALFAGKSDPSAADGRFLQRHPVKAEAFICFRPRIQRHTAKTHAGPGCKLLISVFAQHIAGNGFIVFREYWCSP